MAENVSEVGHVRKYALTWYKRIIRSAVVQKITNGTISSVGKNDYGCGEIIGRYGQTLKLNRQDLCRCQVVNVFVGDIKT